MSFHSSCICYIYEGIANIKIKKIISAKLFVAIVKYKKQYKIFDKTIDITVKLSHKDRMAKLIMSRKVCYLLQFSQ